MVDKRKFNKILTAILIMVIIAIIVALGFVGYDFFQRYYINKGADDAIDEFDSQLSEITKTNSISGNFTMTGNEISDDTSSLAENDNAQSTKTNTSKSHTSSSTKSSAISLKYKGFDVAGKIEIPKINIKYPVLSVATLSSMKISVGIVFGPGLNQVGNTVIMGHNYRNGALFSKNKKLNIGDEIYITDLTGTRLKYIIYNKYETSSTDFDYATRDTAGAKEISLASCTDDSSSRLIIWARAEE